MFQFPALVVLAVFATCSCYHVTEPEAPEGFLYLPMEEEKCVLPCHVELNEEDVPPISAPRVSWFFLSNSNTFVALNDSDFWNKEYNKHYCDKTAYPFPDFREYSGPSHFDCIRQTGNGSEGDKTSYNCSLKYRKCFLGTYKCRVSLSLAGDAEEIVKEVTTRVITPPLLIIEPPIPICFQPSAHNLTAKFNPRRSSIKLTWTSSVRPANSSCKIPYCVGSRRYRAKMLVFNSMPLNSTAKPNSYYETPWIKVNKRKGTFHTFTDAMISSDKFFVFQVRNTRRYGTATIPDMNFVQTKYSGPFYFGEKERATLTEPLQDTVHLVPYGESIIIRCSATGKPLPVVTLSYDEYGKKVAIQESTSSAQLDFIAISSQRFYCTAKNYILNEYGVVERVEKSASITVNLAGR